MIRTQYNNLDTIYFPITVILRFLELLRVDTHISYLSITVIVTRMKFKCGFAKRENVSNYIFIYLIFIPRITTDSSVKN